MLSRSETIKNIRELIKDFPFYPQPGYIVVVPIPNSYEQDGIELSYRDKNETNIAVVVAIGQPDGTFVNEVWDKLQLGALVLPNTNAKNKITYEGQPYVMVHQSEALAVLKDKDFSTIQAMDK